MRRHQRRIDAMQRQLEAMATCHHYVHRVLTADEMKEVHYPEWSERNGARDAGRHALR